MSMKTPSSYMIGVFDETNFPTFIIIDCPEITIITVTQHMIAMHMVDACKLVGVAILSIIGANLSEYDTTEVITSPECSSGIPSSPQNPVSIISNDAHGKACSKLFCLRYHCVLRLCHCRG